MNRETEPAYDDTGENRLLIVDDDRDFVAGIADILESRGYVLETAHSAELAEEKIKDFDGHVALIDIRLGRANGIELITKLRQQRPGIMCVMMTAYAGTETAIRALDRGAYAYLRKPLEVRDLLATLDRCFEKLRLEQEKAAAEEALSEQNRRLTEINARLRAMVDATRALATCSRIDQMGKLILEQFARNMAAEGGSLFLMQDGKLILAHSLDPGHAPAALDLPLKKGSPFHTAMTKGTPVLVKDIAQEPNLLPSGWDGYRDGSLLVMPLADEHEDLVGLLALHNRTNPPFTEQDSEICLILASYTLESLRATRALVDLRAGEEKLDGIVSSLIDQMFMIDEDFNIAWVNHIAERAFGSDLVGRKCYPVLHGRDRLCDSCVVEQCFADGEVHERETEALGPDNAISNMWCTASVAARHEDGRPKMVLEICRDITRRKRSEQALKRSEERMRLVVESSPIGVVVVQDATYKYTNPALVKMFGFDRAEEIVGLPVEDLYFPQDRGVIKDIVRAGPGTDETTPYHEMTGRKKDGDPIRVVLWHNFISFDEERALLGFVVDITEEEALRAQLLQAQKMEAVGALASGIAHDFNNLLTAVLGHAEMLIMGKTLGDPGHKSLQAIRQAALNGGDLVKRMLAFSRKVEAATTPIDLTQKVRHVETLLHRTIPKTIKIEMLLADDLPPINADAAQVEQILLNLALNARDAMPDGGKLVFETRKALLDEQYCSTHLEAGPGEYVQLAVSDTGHGMTEDVRQHVFEPFFTTKHEGEGTGLGLAMVFGIVRAHRGHITCESESGVGATFRIYFPVVDEQVESHLATTMEIPAFGTETILLVEDDAAVRDLGKEVLIWAGYKVITASNGIEVLDIYRKKKAEIALTILDLVMAEMDGRRCVTELLRIDPDARIIITGGHLGDEPKEEAFGGGAKGFMEKPYDVKLLLRTVRKVLDE